jgi:hypothetical protein
MGARINGRVDGTWLGGLDGRIEGSVDSVKKGRELGTVKGRVLGMVDGRILGVAHGRVLGMVDGRNEGIFDGITLGRVPEAALGGGVIVTFDAVGISDGLVEGASLAVGVNASRIVGAIGGSGEAAGDKVGVVGTTEGAPLCIVGLHEGLALSDVEIAGTGARDGPVLEVVVKDTGAALGTGFGTRLQAPHE